MEGREMEKGMELRMDLRGGEQGRRMEGRKWREG